MTFDDAVCAMRRFEGRAICLDTIVLRPGPGSEAGILHDGAPGVLRRKHPSEIDEFWWTLPEAAYFECQGSHSFVVRKASFRGAEWNGDILVLDLTAQLWRVVPMIRSDSLRDVLVVRDDVECR